MSTPPAPPLPISLDAVKIVRKLENGQVVTHYVDANGNEVGISPTYHLVPASAFNPPPT